MPGYLKPHVVTISPGPADPNCKSPPKPEGGPGWYRVELTLYPHPVLFSETDVTSLRNDFIGDSLIKVSELLIGSELPRHIFTIKLLNANLEYFVFCNKKGRLSHFDVRLQSTCLDEAIDTARKFLQPFLAGWATRFNTPMHVFRIRALEERTNVGRNILYPQLFSPVSISRNETDRLYSIPKDTRGISLYHEALNATSVKHQFLCYYKVIELVQGLRVKRAAQGGPQVEKNVRKIEVLSDEEWFRSHLSTDLQARLIGKKFATIQDDILRPIRNRIAHGLLDDSADGDIVDDEIYPYMPVVKLLAERLLMAEVEEEDMA